MCFRRICVFTLMFFFPLPTCRPHWVFLWWLFVLSLSLSLWLLYWPCIFLVPLGTGLQQLDWRHWPLTCLHGATIISCAPLCPFLLLTVALIPLAALCLLAACQQWEMLLLKCKWLPDEHNFFSTFGFYQELNNNLAEWQVLRVKAL